MEASEVELRELFGPRADYYVMQWSGASRRTVNRPALFLSGLWLPFRRMYLATAIFYSVALLETVVEELLLWRLGYPRVLRLVDAAVMLVPAIVCGVWGNRWYMAHARRILAQTRALELPMKHSLGILRNRGGTRRLHAVGSLGAFMLLAYGVGYALEALLGP